ncbi:hypothetical protein EJ05DRAFT_464946 [Pseudovirgaria hyperparasitica]|uniref:ubiquitinyl hydrolase 1 n=1 Tax=Pseudovirgaria hyperparasitica TaxID=470096 RepID=A0A6A6W730_9PEZI|nr:uncharacterized protein EJ05DRAFT_464946 [Pseudovirgaria hyperparasitica]KAF2758009.1 hypothetical protein EJ05DRAFT_464946 [Pseudovirgaria hyperparasitica]
MQIFSAGFGVTPTILANEPSPLFVFYPILATFSRSSLHQFFFFVYLIKFSIFIRMASIETVYNHIVLPPRLPDHQDPRLEETEVALFERLIHACTTLQALLRSHPTEPLATVSSSLQHSLQLSKCNLDVDQVLNSFEESGAGSMVLYHLREQNSALIISKPNSDGKNQNIIIEVFELSPQSTHVLASKGALLWDFPGRAVEVPQAEFVNPHFRSNLARYLEQANRESLSSFSARADKAKASVAESRDTKDPALVSQCLMAILEGLGSPVEPTGIQKRVNDDVNFGTSEIPWRRAPLWLGLRVTSQLQLYRALGDMMGKTYYKLLGCVLLAELLRDGSGVLHIELSVLLRTKLCRRLAKLEGCVSGDAQTLLNNARGYFQDVIDQANETFGNAWTSYKRVITRKIPMLSRFASDSDLILPMPRSKAYLEERIRSLHFNIDLVQSLNAQPEFSIKMGEAHIEAELYYSLALMEDHIRCRTLRSLTCTVSPEDRVISLAKDILGMFARIEPLHLGPDQRSIFVLSVFDLWAEMDKWLAVACPLTVQYDIMFTPELLNVLQLSLRIDQERLRVIQEYMFDRKQNCRYPGRNMLSSIDDQCFAVNFVSEQPDLQALRAKIQKTSTKRRVAKEREWAEACTEYDMHAKGASKGSCVCRTDMNGARIVKGCTRCWHWRMQKRMKMTCHEDYLSADEVQSGVTVFELGTPHHIEMYRQVVWKILLDLAYPGRPVQSSVPSMELDNYSQLGPYRRKRSTSITLASQKKSFLQTHFSSQRMKVELKDILLPNGLKFAYYDSEAKIWVDDLNLPPTLQHLFGIHVPRCIINTVIEVPQHPPATVTGPSSYEIVAGQTKCPAGISKMEFASYQKLLSTMKLRWMAILVELSSTNINFSSEDTMLVLTQLSLQVGPLTKVKGKAMDHHHFLQESQFCECLLEALEQKLSIIESNWREHNCMAVIIILLLRVIEMSPKAYRTIALELLGTARKTTLKWATILRTQIMNATDPSTVDVATTYGFWAAILCRRTFAHMASSATEMTAEDVNVFIQASLALRANFVVAIKDLPSSLQNFATADLKMVQALRPQLVIALLLYQVEVETAIKATWGEPHSVSDRNATWVLQLPPYEHWVTAVFRRQLNGRVVEDNIQYHFLEGYLLVNGKPLGRLPNEISSSADVQDLFGQQHLLTFPATFNGMSYRLGTRMQGHEVYFGTKGDRVIIQAWSEDGLHEFIPRRLFKDDTGFDLPASLLDDCVHWLKLDSGRLETRRKPHVWKTIASDWVVDMNSATAKRRCVRLVSPQSRLFSQITQIFGGFEIPERITAYQPARGSLCVELRYLDLTFFLNRNRLFESKELQSEIDPNQDPGTFYGLRSKIVLRNPLNYEQRSIITSTGPLIFERQGMHVSVTAASTSTYARFNIDKVLGRLTCAPEPLLIYLKARYHAYTSFVLPDVLTGRTGQEEALAILQSGQASPWTSLNSVPISILGDIANLCPSREFYPTGMKRLQRCTWKDDLTVSIQGDRLFDAVSSILRRSQELDSFIQNTGKDLYTQSEPDYLRDRAICQRQRFERASILTENKSLCVDLKYPSRDKALSENRSTEVYQTVVLLCMKEFNLDLPRTLAQVFEKFPLIGGFKDDLRHETLTLATVMDVDLGQQWGSLARILSHAKGVFNYDNMYRLAVLSFNKNLSIDAIQMLAAFARIPEMESITWPEEDSYTDFKHHEVPKKKPLQALILQSHPAPMGRMQGRRFKREIEAEDHHAKCVAESKLVADFFCRQWPTTELSIDGFETTIIDLEDALERITPEWERLSRNRGLSIFVDQVQSILDRYYKPLAFTTPHVWTGQYVAVHESKLLPAQLTPSLMTLASDASLEPQPNKVVHIPFLNQVTDTRNGPSGPQRPAPVENDRTAMEKELEKILCNFTRSFNDVRARYGADLEASLSVLRNRETSSGVLSKPPSLELIGLSINKTSEVLSALFKSMSHSLDSSMVTSDWLRRGGLWPCSTTTSLLELLRSSTLQLINKDLRDLLLEYASQLATLQWLLRMQDAALKSDQNSLLEEWKNPGHYGWAPRDHTEWLLMEAESNLLIRGEQHNVAKEVIHPRNGKNTVLQLNMGRGKTSCIMPMVAAELANGKRLVRLIVPKALLLQTAQILQSRLGGLIGRRIVHIPFSRRTKTTGGILGLFEKLHKECLKDGDIILAAPEHLMSFKLSGRQRLVDGNLKEAMYMMRFQDWLDQNCRDVLDESDLSLAVKTQLVYPSGNQVAVDGHPYRWKIAQELLAMVQDQLPALVRQYPRHIDFVARGKGFPLLYILHEDVEDALNKHLIEQISDMKTPLLETKNEVPLWMGSQIRLILNSEEFEMTAFEQILKYFKDPLRARKTLLACRGLLSCRILLLCLKKRWGTQYGLHPKRDPIAVPFEAKGVPSEQSEFGHPDVSIVLTILSFYYTGLSIEQFRQGLGLVLQADDAAFEYDRWSNGAAFLPETLQHWSVINLDDKMQIHHLWTCLRHNQGVLDHFMNNFVFPQHAKQFKVKLQSSGWDLPLFPSNAATTGFSGTNDNKILLPLTISQNDLPELHQTSAEVLTYLIDPRNRKYHIAETGGRWSTEEDLLHSLKAMKVRILIDAGAFIMEMDNKSLVELWLKIDHEAKAAVFFGEDNRAWVQYRGGRKAPLLATPFVDNFEGCLVYLDENHTRGVDMKFPSVARGALTLALDQTKDHTVQAAMRLRKLGTTQSIVWIAPPQVHQSIVDFCKPRSKEEIDSSHVVSWLLEQTCRSNEHMQSLFIAQGTDFCRRFDAVARNRNAITDIKQRENLLDAIQHPEMQTLEQLYGDAETPERVLQQRSSIKHPALQPFVDDFNRRQNSSAMVDAQRTSALEEVEQERQVTQEIQEVRQVQAPGHATALVFPGLHPAIKSFVQTGSLPDDCGYFRSLEVLVQTSLGKAHGLSTAGSRVWVSLEFMRTVQRKGKAGKDNFLRPVEYLLFSSKTYTALVIIPEEAEAVLPLLFSQRYPSMHLITYAAPVSKGMLRFSDLSFYAFPTLPSGLVMPRWLTTELGILAGRLYFHFSEYTYIKNLVTRDAHGANESSQASDSGSRSVTSNTSTESLSAADSTEPVLSLCPRPAPFLLSYLALRRHGQDILSTPMGYVCQGRPLTEKHAFFAGGGGVAVSSIASTANTGEGMVRGEFSEEEEDGDDDDDEEEEGEEGEEEDDDDDISGNYDED